MPEGMGGEDPSARSALHEALLDEIGLDDVLDGVARLGEGRGDGLDACLLYTSDAAENREV